MSAKQVKCAFRHLEAKVGNRRQAEVPCSITNVWFVRMAAARHVWVDVRFGAHFDQCRRGPICLLFGNFFSL